MTKFKLPDRDVEFLNALGVKWESGMSGGEGYVILHDVGVDTNLYEVQGGGDKTDILFILQPGYPSSQIDMSSFYPYLSRVDKKSIPNLHYSFYHINGVDWQTWSRHRTGYDSWNPETDGIATHLAYTDMFLQREVSLDQVDAGSSRLKSTFIKKTGTGMKILKFCEKPKTGRLFINMS